MNRTLYIAALCLAPMLAACEADESLPTRPRTALPFADTKAQDNASRRVEEAPSRAVPTGGGKELPGQSRAIPSRGIDLTASDSVLTLDVTPTNPNFPISGFTGPSGWNAFGHTTGPQTTYTRDVYKGPMPNLPRNPGTTPMAGSIPAAGEWTLPNSWGQGLLLENYPHRPWPKTTAYYQGIEVKHNPTYYFNLLDHTDVAPAMGPRTTDVVSAAVEVPWFFINTLGMPILMLLEPPLTQRNSDRPGSDPIFLGYLPPTGTVVPAPFPGALHWNYPFLNADGTVKPASEIPRATQPATRP